MIDTMRVGLDQVMLDSLIALMPHFPVLASYGLNMGRTPADIPGGAYYMNPEELPFEGQQAGGLPPAFSWCILEPMDEGHREPWLHEHAVSTERTEAFAEMCPGAASQ